MEISTTEQFLSKKYLINDDDIYDLPLLIWNDVYKNNYVDISNNHLIKLIYLLHKYNIDKYYKSAIIVFTKRLCELKYQNCELCFCDDINSDIIKVYENYNTGIVYHLLGFPTVLRSSDYLFSIELLQRYLNTNTLQKFNVEHICNMKYHPDVSTIDILKLMKTYSSLIIDIFNGDNWFLKFGSSVVLGHNYLCSAIVMYSDTETLDWAVNNGAPIGCNIYEFAAKNNRLDMVKHLRRHCNIPNTDLWDNVYTIAAMNDGIDIILWLNKVLPLPKQVTLYTKYIMQSPHIYSINACYEKGFINKTEYLNAINQFDIVDVLVSVTI